MSYFSVCFFCFFFKQKTAYEMRISDWSSDVCSSDLLGGRHRAFFDLFVDELLGNDDMIFKSDVAPERRQQRVVEPGRARPHRPGEVAQDHLIRMPVGSNSIRPIVHPARPSPDKEIACGN